MAKPSGPGHRPFEILKELLDREKPAAPAPRFSPHLSDEEAFRQEMEGVRPLGWSEKPLSLPAPVTFPKRSDEEADALALLSDFVAGRGEIDPFATGEGVEGASSQEGRRYLARLKRGDFSVQGQLDLHGFGRADARPALERFLREAQRLGYSCVRVVHGRGTHSESEPSLMKREVTRWLSSRRLSRTVVAFASARWRDGGSGAVYVLLRYGAGSGVPPSPRASARRRR
ncbi:MAG TPA: Smr/MutS family protein [Vicinamibacteria bacterium]